MVRPPLKSPAACAVALLFVGLVGCADTGGLGNLDLDALGDIDLDALGDADLDATADVQNDSAVDATDDRDAVDADESDTPAADAEDVQGGGDAADGATDDDVPESDAAGDAVSDSDILDADLDADIATDATGDAAEDVLADATEDVVSDAAADATEDTGLDAGVDGSTDVGTDAVDDAAADTTGDAGHDAAADVSADVEPDAALPFCGDGLRNLLEQCDGADLAGATCETAGGGTGTLACSSGCVFDYSACSEPFMCDDDESEPNNVFTTAVRIDRASSPTSFVLKSGDADVFRMLQAPGCSVTITAIFEDVSGGWELSFVDDRFEAIDAEQTPVEGGVRLSYRVSGGGFGATTLYLLVQATEAAICAPYTLTFQSVCG